jgi:hypothetical protein
VKWAEKFDILNKKLFFATKNSKLLSQIKENSINVLIFL